VVNTRIIKESSKTISIINTKIANEHSSWMMLAAPRYKETVFRKTLLRIATEK